MSIDLNIADVFKLPVKIFAAIALGTGLILFLPDELINKIYLSDFRNDFGFGLGLVFVISISIVGVTFVIACYKSISNIILFSKTKKAREKCINNLDDYQKAIVFSLYSEINHTGELPYPDGSVQWLVQNWIITPAVHRHLTNSELPEFPYKLQPWTIEYLNNHKELLEEMEKATKSLINILENDNSSY